MGTGGFRCGLAILISFFVFPQKVTALGIAGICIAMAAFAGNSYFTFKEQVAKQNAAATPTETEGLLNKKDPERGYSEPIAIGNVKHRSPITLSSRPLGQTVRCLCSVFFPPTNKDCGVVCHA